VSDIRSKRLSTGYETVAGQYRLLSVGPNSTILIKSILVFNAAGVASTIQVWLNAASWIIPLIKQPFTDQSTFEWNGWIAMQDTDQLRIDFDVNGVAWWVSGTLLEGSYDATIVPMDGASTQPMNAGAPL